MKTTRNSENFKVRLVWFLYSSLSVLLISNVVVFMLQK